MARSRAAADRLVEAVKRAVGAVLPDRGSSGSGARLRLPVPSTPPPRVRETASTAGRAARDTARAAAQAAGRSATAVREAASSTVGTVKGAAAETARSARRGARRAGGTARRETASAASTSKAAGGTAATSARRGAQRTREAAATGEPYERWTRAELYERAQELDIEGRSTMNKQQLIDALRAAG